MTKKNVFLPAFRSARISATPLDQLSCAQWIELGEHALPVRSEETAETGMATRSASRTSPCSASATDELPISRISPTSCGPSHSRAIATPTSLLFW